MTTWHIPLPMRPLIKQEVLLRGTGVVSHLSVRVSLLLVPLQPTTMVRRHRVWDNHGFPVCNTRCTRATYDPICIVILVVTLEVHHTCEEGYLAWEKGSEKPLKA